MAESPDVREYVDLTLFDKDPQDLIDQAVADAAIKFPDWTPREAQVEMVNLEGMALEVAELVFAINRIPGAVVEIVLRLFGLDRSLGLPPTGVARFELSDDLGHVIPAGTPVRLDLGLAGVVDFTTDVDVAVAPGALAGVVAITGDAASTAANGVAAETELELLAAIPYVDRVVLDAPVGPGADPEDGPGFLNRGSRRFRRLVTTLVKPAHFTEAALENVDVFRATSIDNFDPGAGGAPGDHGGHVTVLVAGEGGAMLAPARRDAIELELDGMALGNLAVHVEDPAVVAVDVDVTVVRRAGFTEAQVEAAVTERLEAYLDPDSWEWGRDVFRNELLAEVDRADGVDRVVAVVAPAADVPVAFKALVNAGAVNVTVQAP